MTEERTQDIEISNPMLGKLAAHGVRVSDMISLLTFIGVIVLAVFTWKIADALNEHKLMATESTKQLTDATKAGAGATRLMTCILSMSQERRERELLQVNSFCQTMSKLP
jgi:hypothetical protein